MAINVNLIRADQGLAPSILIGDMMFRLKDPYGNWGELFGPITVGEMTLDPGKPTQELIKSGLIETYTQVIGAVMTPGDPSITIKLSDAGVNVLNLALRGTITAVTEAGNTVTNGEVNVVQKGAWLQFPHRNIAASGFSGKSDTTDLVAGTDYLLDDMYLKYGMIYIPTTATNVDLAENQTWSYTYGAVSGSRIDAMQLADMRLQIDMPIQDRNTLNRGFLKVWEAAVSPSSGIDVASNKKIELTLTGIPMTPSGKVAPYYIEWITFA